MGHDKTNYFVVLLLSGMTGAFVAFTLLHDVPSPTLKSYAPVASVMVGPTKVTVPSWELFMTSNIWQIVSTKRNLANDYVPTLTAVSVPHVSGANKVSPTINNSLNALVAAADSKGIKLMLSSAYRSYNEQKTLYDVFLNTKGRQYVMDYVAVAGQSEHQTGLAVDLSTASSSCLDLGEDCSLDETSADWLNEHAPEFGFIVRYPADKQSITGITGEKWHFRFVGVPLAKALSNAGMTLEEFVNISAPAYAQ